MTCGRTKYEDSGGKAGKGGARSLLDSRRLPRRLCTAAADLPTSVESIRGGWEPPRVIARHPGSPRFFPRGRRGAGALHCRP